MQTTEQLGKHAIRLALLMSAGHLHLNKWRNLTLVVSVSVPALIARQPYAIFDVAAYTLSASTLSTSNSHLQ